MNIFKKVAEIDSQIYFFKNTLYAGGEDDVLLRDKANEIFELLDEAITLTGGNGVIVQLLKQTCKEFEDFIIKVLKSRHAPELRKLYVSRKRRSITT
ncbi:MAG: hypothetical protein UY04_C0014G0027 [Parcubacteria group bacterium GW2011_GWA2_47_7]|nr:MAG: hypothetical protein UY04_C0014G0027 [Parcubacteria group bacterium GW2011_GWA2_47_7]